MSLNELIKNNIIILDGATGTLLHKHGLGLNERPETLNLTHKEIITKIHKSYFDAGSNIVCTNTFGANSLSFDKNTLEKIISAAIDAAKQAREQSKSRKEKFIALDIGPTGKMLEPFGTLGFEEAVSVFAETVKLGSKYGADLIMIETMSDSYETKAALLAAKENCDLPVFVSNAYGENGKLMTGASPAAMVAMLEGMGADAVGVNCSFGPDKLIPVVNEYLEYASVPVIMKPNAGLPHDSNGYTVFDIDADEFTELVAGCVSSGVRIVGGCCGTTPEYIEKLSDTVQTYSAPEVTEKNVTCVSSYSEAVVFSNSPVLIGERINPPGKKRFKQVLVENDIGYILNEGIKQADVGVHILDVNVGLPQIDEVGMLRTVVSELQAVTDLPLQIDTSSYEAMEQAMRIYNGCPLINSVNGKAESMEKIFPLMKKYGGVSVALTLDENGIPDTAKGRFEIAKRITEKAKEYGIGKNRLIFDTLTMAVSADKNAPAVTLEALKMIREKLGCHTVLGVSNVSFGLPGRGMINGTFFSLALENGLSAAIMNPFSPDMMKAYYSFRALRGLDENCRDYIGFADSVTDETKIVKSGGETAFSEDDLKTAIIKGLKDKASDLSAQLLKSTEPLALIEEKIIPALDSVGVDYESGKVYLPQLLMAAEAAQAAFAQVKAAMAKREDKGESRGVFVIATVEGDIHDIGKNIVKLLLSNYGFDVHDLGKDVPCDDVVAKVKELHAPFAGLSALMTTTVPAMEKTVRAIHEEAPWCKVIVGGAVLTQEYADKIGADKYGKDAMDTVRYALSLCSKD